MMWLLCLLVLRGHQMAQKTEGSALLLRLKQLIWDSPKLWEGHVWGVEVECNEHVVAKVIGCRNMAEYTTMQYLADHAPDIPTPLPHGLVRFGHYIAIFMSYIPSIKLTKVWPTPSHKQKLSLQCQLDGIFSKLRTLQKEDGNVLGGTDGEGVKYYHLSDTPHKDCIYTAADFDNLNFSIHHYGSTMYTSFLRSFLNDQIQGPVFTRGDVRQDNIMVDFNHDNDCVVTGPLAGRTVGSIQSIMSVLNWREHWAWQARIIGISTCQKALRHHAFHCVGQWTGFGVCMRKICRLDLDAWWLLSMRLHNGAYMCI